MSDLLSQQAMLVELVEREPEATQCCLSPGVWQTCASLLPCAGDRGTGHLSPLVLGFPCGGVGLDAGSGKGSSGAGDPRLVVACPLPPQPRGGLSLGVA